MRYKKAGEGLPKQITHMPLAINIEDVYPMEKYATIKQIDDEKMLIDQSGINWVVLGLSIFGTVLLTWGYIVSYELNLFKSILYGLVYTVCVCVLLKSLVATKKVFIFDRKDGTLTYPELIWRTSKTIPFKDACFIRNRVGPYAGEATHLSILRADGISRSVIVWDQSYEYFSFFLWYMDRNRPLPPGTAFDPYRQRDFERRQAEGFPKPLYPSRIDTPDIVKNPNRYKGDEGIFKP